jgi:hypothetical protein
MSYSRDLHALGSFRIPLALHRLGFVSYFPGATPLAYPLAIYFPLTIAGPKKLP